MKAASGIKNGARGYLHKGVSNFGKNSKLLYTRDNNIQGAKTLYQPQPPFLKFGSKTKTSNKPPSERKLKTQFGGKMITLESSGKITISANPSQTN
jgi:hypothetical protein